MDQHHVVAGVLRRDRQVLLCRRSPTREWYPGVWDLPGGHVEVGEQPLEALRRELLEELGVEIGDDPGHPLDRIARIARPETGLHLTIWLVTDWTGTVANRQPHEHDRIGWFGAPDLLRLALADDSYITLLHEQLR